MANVSNAAQTPAPEGANNTPADAEPNSMSCMSFSAGRNMDPNSKTSKVT